MSNLFYVLKIGLVTFLFVVIMQIEVGQKSIEHHAELFIRKSALLEPIRDVAHGGFLLARNAYLRGVKTVDSFVTKQFRAENSPGKRKIAEIKRSLAFQKQEAQKLEADIRGSAEEADTESEYTEE